jgi:hypothetical protein
MKESFYDENISIGLQDLLNRDGFFLKSKDLITLQDRQSSVAFEKQKL